MDEGSEIPDAVSFIFDSSKWVDGIDPYSMGAFEERLESRLTELRTDSEKALIESEIEIFMQERLIIHLMGSVREAWQLMAEAKDGSADKNVKRALDLLTERAGDTWFLYKQTRASGTPRTVLRRGRWSELYRDK